MDFYSEASFRPFTHGQISWKISGDRALDYNKRTNKKFGRFDVAVSCRYRFQIGVYITANDIIFCRNHRIENK